jgi:hypothetical protein
VLGGVIYPIMFERLLTQIGFGWSVRVSGFLSLACCALALATVTSRLPATGKSGPWIDTQTFKDKRFTLLAAGCFLVALGTSTTADTQTRLILFVVTTRFVYTTNLYRQLRQRSFYRSQNSILCPRCYECGWRTGTYRSRHPIRCIWLF